MRRFDLVVFKSRGRFVVHRVLGISKDHLLQAGDNYSSPSRIHKESVVGRAAIIKGQSYVIDLEKKRNVFLNAVISAIHMLAHNMPKYRYRFLRMSDRLIILLLRIMKTRGRESP